MALRPDAQPGRDGGAAQSAVTPARNRIDRSTSNALDRQVMADMTALGVTESLTEFATPAPQPSSVKFVKSLRKGDKSGSGLPLLTSPPTDGRN